jgi:hypothetical protein
MDRRTPYTLSVLESSTNGAEDSRSFTQARLRDFVLQFQLDNAFIYRYAAHIHHSPRRLFFGLPELTQPPY